MELLERSATVDEIEEGERKIVIAGEVAAAVALVTGHEVKQRESTSNVSEASSFNFVNYVPPPSQTHVVVRGFNGFRSDELTLEVGDIVGITQLFSDGWAEGKLISKRNKVGFFPLQVLTRQKHGASQSVGHTETGQAYFMPKRRSSTNSGDSNASTELLYAHQVPNRTTSIIKVEISRTETEKLGVAELKNKWERQSAVGSELKNNAK
ncbi:hypothetical protein BC830DRAFT_1152709 [Chytriomyces sp. MP71]|nr:hypothetical protein BC830DRAFT_1152709 [Chytriomyces sp. MP71]